MKVYKLRDRASGKFINKLNKKVDRIYQTKRHAAAAASLLVVDDWKEVNDTSWWKLTPQDRRDFRESLIEIVEYDCIENTKQAKVDQAVAIIEDFLAFMDDPNVEPDLKADVQAVWRQGMRKVGLIT